MVLEGLKYKILVFKTLARARNNTFAKYRLISKSQFTNKMCSFSVQNHKLCSEQGSIFVKVFRYDTCIRKISKTIFGLL